MAKKREQRDNPRTGEPDALQEWKDWQDHQYLRGYWVGGKIPPFLLGKRPNRFGHVLVATGVSTLLMLGLQLALMWGRVSWSDIDFGLAFALLQLGAGVSLLRR